MRQAAFKLGWDKIAHALVTGSVNEGELFGTRDGGNDEINALERELEPFLVTIVDHMDLDTVFGKFAPNLRRKTWLGKNRRSSTLEETRDWFRMCRK